MTLCKGCYGKSALSEILEVLVGLRAIVMPLLKAVHDLSDVFIGESFRAERSGLL